LSSGTPGQLGLIIHFPPVLSALSLSHWDLPKEQRGLQRLGEGVGIGVGVIVGSLVGTGVTVGVGVTSGGVFQQYDQRQ